MLACILKGWWFVWLKLQTTLPTKIISLHDVVNGQHSVIVLCYMYLYMHLCICESEFIQIRN